jgi:acyl-coenzyme A thioesterase 13
LSIDPRFNIRSKRAPIPKYVCRRGPPLPLGPPTASRQPSPPWKKIDYAGWDARLTRESCTLISATATTPANAVFDVTIDPYLWNVGGTLHGSAASTILDNLTGEALHVAARKGWMDYRSVSRTLTVTFLRPVVMGSKVRVEVEMVGTRRTMANVRRVIRDAKGRVCVSCVHDKAVLHGERP